jgi:DNA topoisomerase-1
MGRLKPAPTLAGRKACCTSGVTVEGHARAAGLRYVCDDAPGIRREMGPLGFRYRGADGRLVRDAATLKRIRGLVIPPAWAEVWICRDANGHLQATGRDARGRKQYRYHPAWRTTRDEHKFDRLQAFAAALPQIRGRVRRDLARPGLPRVKVIAAVIQLLEKSLIRVGNEEYARSNGSYGLTTMEDRHVQVKGARVQFRFRGKSGKRHDVAVDDPRLARIVKQCRELPGHQLFQYVDPDGRVQDLDSADVNAYLKEVTGEDFTAKDFRTWAGTVLALSALAGFDPPPNTSRARKHVVQAIDAVSGLLGNTRSVCRKSYVHPAVVDAYAEGSLQRIAKRQSPEAAVVAVLRWYARETRKVAA